VQPASIPADNTTETEIAAIAAHFVRTPRPYRKKRLPTASGRDGDSQPRYRSDNPREREPLGVPTAAGGPSVQMSDLWGI
jgi:hypothetical protein